MTFLLKFCKDIVSTAEAHLPASKSDDDDAEAKMTPWLEIVSKIGEAVT